jgi:metal-sulfur cluster biosynthetic enzyme
MQLLQQLKNNDPYFAQKKTALQSLYEVIDPELFINIMDLGLVYGIDFSPEKKIQVTMTLSTPHCPLGEAIQSGVRNRILQDFPDYDVQTTIVWEPLWSLDDVSDEGRKLLGMAPRV